MENPACTEEDTYTEEGATATPPGIEIAHNQAPHSLSHIMEWWYPMLKAQKWTGP